MPHYKKQKRSWQVAIFATLLLTACQNYYKASPVYIGNAAERVAKVDSLRLAERYFILRNGSESFYMRNPTLSADQKTMDCMLDTLPFFHKWHITNGGGGKMRYKNNPVESMVLNEVHFHIQPDSTAVPGHYTLQLDKIQRIELIEKDKGRTTTSYVAAVGIAFGAVVLVAVIIAALKSSCPFVSAYNGNEFALQGEIYGGAIYPQLARHDHLPLKMAPLSDGSLQVKISNELHEHQFTDMAELWVITHDKNSEVLADETGNLYTVSAPQAPESATLNGKKDVTASLKKSGDNAMLYMDDTSAVNETNEVVMKFNKPVTAKKGKLMLSLKNSYFLDLLYGELAKGFGNYYTAYIAQQRKKPAAELLKWTKEQQIPLEVSVKTNSGWKKITDITTIGPVATRNIVVPVELPETTEPFTEIKLSSGFMFWEIDHAAMDYSAENTFTVQKITPSKATDELGKNILPELQKEDAVYLAQPDIGNIATLVYNCDPLSDDSKTRTYILHSKGYYEHVRDFKNKPDVVFLNQFKKPNAFPMFGMQFYKKITAENIKTLARSN